MHSGVHRQIAIAATATAGPPYAVTREEIKIYLQPVVPLEPARLDAMMSIVDNSQVECRYLIHPVECIVQPRPLGQISLEYQEHALRLGRKVAEEYSRGAEADGNRPYRHGFLHWRDVSAC